MTTEIRPLETADYEAYARIAGYAFNNLPGQIAEYLVKLSEAGELGLGLFEDGELATALVNRRFELNVNGALAPSNGIGMVASAPATRRRGLVRELFAAHLAELREAGVVLSLLYPFQFRFYNRMGWGFGDKRLQLKVSPKEFAAYGRPVGRVREVLYAEKGLMRPATGETMDSVIDMLARLYKPEAARWNLSAERTHAMWQRMLEVSRGRRYVFVWEPACGGEAQGYFIAHFREERDEADVTSRELTAETPDAWRGLFHFLSCHDGQNKNVVFDLPFAHQLIEVLDNPRVEAKPGHGPMVRAVDLAGLLAARGTAGCLPGRCTLDVTDTLAPWNHGRFEVSLTGGQVAMHPVAADAGGAADLAGPIDAISQLAAGVRTVDEMMRFGLVQGKEGPGLTFARGLFPARQIWHNEYY